MRPTWKEGWWSLGTILYDQNSYAPAARAFTKLVSLDPKNGTAHLMLGLCQYQLNLNDPAMANIQAAKDLGIRKEEQLENVLQYHEGMLLLRKGDYERAIESLQLLVSKGVQSEALDTALGMSVLLMLPKNAPAEKSPERQIVIRAGRAEHDSLLKKTDDAKKEYLALTQEFPDFPNVHYAFGRFLLTIQDTEEAVPAFQEEIKRNPTHIRARMQIAATHYRVDSAAGIPIATEVVKLEPKYPFGHYLLGLLYFDSGDVTHAIPELETAARMSPREAQFQFAWVTHTRRPGEKKMRHARAPHSGTLEAPKSLQASPPRMAIGLPAWTMLLVRRRRAQKEITRDASAEPEGLPASHGRIVASLGSSARARTSSISHSSNFVSREEGPLRIGSPGDERYHVASCKRPVS